MAYREAGGREAVLEMWPPPRAARGAVRARGTVAPPGLPTLLVRGAHRRGALDLIARALADEGVNVAFLVHQVLGRRFSAVMGFESGVDARRAMRVIRRVAGAARKRR
jgi:hypothetical protein